MLRIIFTFVIKLALRIFVLLFEHLKLQILNLRVNTHK